MINDIRPEHFEKILNLNTEFEHWLSPLDAAGLESLLSSCIYERQIGGGDAVLLAISSETDIAGHGNLAWLKARRQNFIYIDRVIVGAAAQGKGYGAKLYKDLAVFARAKGYDNLTCEVNTRPDNPPSHSFHLRQGYLPLGDQDIPEKGKSVRYYAKALN